MTAKKRIIDVRVVIPDASPILTLARLRRLDLLETFSVPIHVVDQVHFEVTKRQNDPDGLVEDYLARQGNRIQIIETSVGIGFKARLARNAKTASKNLGEIAVDEYATMLAHTTGPSFVPLVLFEDPDVLELRIAKLKDVHLLNTTAWLNTLHQSGVLPEGKDLIARINAFRITPLVGLEKPARTKKIRSQWLRLSKDDP